MVSDRFTECDAHETSSGRGPHGPEHDPDTAATPGPGPGPKKGPLMNPHRKDPKPLTAKQADDLISSVLGEPVEPSPRSQRLPAGDGVDYRRRVLARLTGRPAKNVQPDDPEQWKLANDCLDLLGLQ